MKNNVKFLGLAANIVAIAVMCTILLGSTFAWFTDSVGSSGNKIQAGTLKVDLELLDNDGDWHSVKDENKPIFDYCNCEPGYTDIKIFKVVNEGTLALKWKAKIVANGSLSALADIIDVCVLPSEEELTYPTERTLDGYIYAGTVADFVKGFEMNTTGKLLAEEEAYLGIALKMNPNAGNEYQGLDLIGSFDIRIIATQLSSEDDGFGDDYDSGAEYPTVASNPQELKDAMLVRNARITLENDIIVTGNTPTQWGSYMFVANGREVTIDLNGHDIVFDESASKAIQFAFTTANGGTLNIVGDGNIITQNRMSGIFWGMNARDHINIYGGNFMSNSHEGDVSKSNSILYVTSGNIDVYGGKFYYPSAKWCANAQDTQGNRLGIVLHVGVLLQHDSFQSGDAARIQLAEGCMLVPVEVDGEIWYEVTSNG